MRITTLFSATAMSLVLASAAHATDDNAAYIDQAGQSNAALITQSGAENTAGLAADPLLQDGDDNDLDIVQSGNNNEIGTDVTRTGGDQSGDDNMATITQSTNENTVNSFSQISVAGPTRDASGLANILVIDQNTGDDNEVVNAVQSYAGNAGGGLVNPDATLAPNSMIINQQGTGNTLRSIARQVGGGQEVDILQTGDSNRVTTVDQRGYRNLIDIDQMDSGAGVSGPFNNDISGVRQRGIDNTAILSQSGTDNRIDSVNQTGDNNTANFGFTGNDNGSGGLTSPYAGAVGATDSSVLQTGDDNVTALTVDGDNNQFGFTQIGDRNTADNLALTGSDNQIGAMQDGNDNLLDLGAITGNRNDVGVLQNGGSNHAMIDIIDTGTGGDSDDNSVSVTQTSFIAGGPLATNEADIDIDGDGNDVTASQSGNHWAGITVTGNSNDIDVNQINGTNKQPNFGADVDVTGDANLIGVVQGGSGNWADVDVLGDSNNFDVTQLGSNSATVNITGDLNGVGVLGGDAATASTGVADAGTMMTAGLIYQAGSGNNVSLTVRDDRAGADASGDSNVFALFQDGDTNTISGLQNGDGNQVAVAQIGNGNLTNFSQTGSMNNLGVTQ